MTSFWQFWHSLPAVGQAAIVAGTFGAFLTGLFGVLHALIKDRPKLAIAYAIALALGFSCLGAFLIHSYEPSSSQTQSVLGGFLHSPVSGVNALDGNRPPSELPSRTKMLLLSLDPPIDRQAFASAAPDPEDEYAAWIIVDSSIHYVQDTDKEGRVDKTTVFYDYSKNAEMIADPPQRLTVERFGSATLVVVSGNGGNSWSLVDVDGNRTVDGVRKN